MSDLRVNSIAGALLGSVLGIMVVGTVSDSIFATHYEEKPGWAPKIEQAGGGGGAPKVEPPPDFGTLFADPAALQALVERGQRLSGECVSCHTFEAGGAVKTGPNLHGVFGRQVAGVPGFSYTAGMTAHGGVWDYDSLNEFLRAPTQVVRGTRMTYAGIRNTENRVAMIAYLRSLTNPPPALPAPRPPEAEAAPAGDGAAPATEGGAPAAQPKEG